MEQKPFTNEQKTKLRKLYGKVALDALFNGMKLGTLSFVSNIIIVLMNNLFVKNEAFVLCSVAFSVFLIFRSYRLSSLKRYDMFNEEQKKILES